MQYWADLQSVHGFRCYDNIAPRVGAYWQSVHMTGIDSIAANAKCQRVHACSLVLALYAWLSHSAEHFWESVIKLISEIDPKISAIETKVLCATDANVNVTHRHNTT